jgi:NADH-quinone oxidoreductase subunit J
MIISVIFYIFSVLAVLGSLFVITTRNPILSAMFKIFTFCTTAVLWLTIQQLYFSLLLVIVYIGAVLVMFLFVIMMVDINFVLRKNNVVYYRSFVFFTCSFLGFFISYLLHNNMGTHTLYTVNSSLLTLGREMFRDKYLYIFEISAMILLSSIISAIALTFRTTPTRSKYFRVEDQTSASLNTRLDIIKIPNHKSTITQGTYKDD